VIDDNNTASTLQGGTVGAGGTITTKSQEGKVGLNKPLSRSRSRSKSNEKTNERALFKEMYFKDRARHLKAVSPYN